MTIPARPTPATTNKEMKTIFLKRGSLVMDLIIGTLMSTLVKLERITPVVPVETETSL